jgi:hypothetical protein
MSESTLLNFTLSGAVPLVIGIILLRLSYMPDSSQPRFWKSWRRPGEGVSLRAVGVLGVSFGLVQSVVTLVSLRPSVYIACSEVLLVAALSMGLAKKRRYPGLVEGSGLLSRATKLIPQIAAVMAFILLLNWPWALWRAGTRWESPEPLVMLSAVCWSAGLLIGIVIVVLLSTREFCQIFRRRSSRTH